MTPEAILLDALESAGLAVFVGEDGGLKCKGPSRRLTPALKAEVEVLRPELTALVACRPSPEQAGKRAKPAPRQVYQTLLKPRMAPIGPQPWVGRDAELMAWAAGLSVEDLPAAPFTLRPGHVVQGGALWLASLQADVAAGPRGPRARTGALQGDVATLRGLVAAPRDEGAA